MLTHELLTSRIIGAAFRVHNALGAGYLEHIYLKALAIELEREGLDVQIEVPIPVHYSGYELGNCIADLIVNEFFVVEAKAQESILPGHQAQLRAYLKSGNYQDGMVVNFGPKKVEVKRVQNGRRDKVSG